MIRILRLCVFLLLSLLFLMLGAAVRLFLFLLRIAPERTTAHLTSVWAASMLWVTGISVRTDSAAPVAEGTLLAANHQSYLDIIIIASVLPTLFVAKSDVRQWPLLGWLAALGGTLFIDRAALRGAVAANERIEQCLLHGVNVQFFPEGTSSNGSGILPFRPFLFQSAMNVGRPVQPVTINYCSVDDAPVDAANRDILCWYGDMTFPDHFMRLLSIHRAVVSVTIHPPVPHGMMPDPKSLAFHCREQTERAFQPIP